MVLSVVRLIDRQGWCSWYRWRALAIMTIVPAVVAVGIFYLVGGFSLGTGAEVYDLADKGFNPAGLLRPARLPQSLDFRRDDDVAGVRRLVDAFARCLAMARELSGSLASPEAVLAATSLDVPS